MERIISIFRGLLLLQVLSLCVFNSWASAGSHQTQCHVNLLSSHFYTNFEDSHHEYEKFWMMYKNNDQFYNWLTEKIGENGLDYLVNPQNDPDMIKNIRGLISAFKRQQQSQSKTSHPESRTIDFDSKDIYGDDEYLKAGKPWYGHIIDGTISYPQMRTTYERKVMLLRKGYRVMFDGKQFVLGRYLGGANATHIFEVANAENRVIRIPITKPFLTQRISNDSPLGSLHGVEAARTLIYFAAHKGEDIDGAHLKTPKIYEVGTRYQYLVVEQVHGSVTGQAFINEVDRILFEGHMRSSYATLSDLARMKTVLAISGKAGQKEVDVKIKLLDQLQALMHAMDSIGIPIKAVNDFYSDFRSEEMRVRTVKAFSSDTGWQGAYKVNAFQFLRQLLWNDLTEKWYLVDQEAFASEAIFEGHPRNLLLRGHRHVVSSYPSSDAARISVGVLRASGEDMTKHYGYLLRSENVESILDALRFGNHSEADVPRLVELLEHEDMRVQHESEAAIKKVGNTALPDLRSITKGVLSDRVEVLRLQLGDDSLVNDILNQYLESRGEARERLSERLFLAPRESVERALVVQLPRLRDQIEITLQALGSQLEEERWMAATIVGVMGPAALDHLSAIVDQLGQSNKTPIAEKALQTSLQKILDSDSLEVFITLLESSTQDTVQRAGLSILNSVYSQNNNPIALIALLKFLINPKCTQEIRRDAQAHLSWITIREPMEITIQLGLLMKENTREIPRRLIVAFVKKNKLYTHAESAPIFAVAIDDIRKNITKDFAELLGHETGIIDIVKARLDDPDIRASIRMESMMFHVGRAQKNYPTPAQVSLADIASDVLSKMDDNSVEACAERLTSGSISEIKTILRGFESLAAIGLDLTPLIPVLESHLSTSDQARIRLESVRALGKLGELAQGSTALLIETIKRDDDPKIRLASIEAIGKIWPEPSDVVLETLTGILDAHDSSVASKVMSVKTLEEMREIPEPLMNRLGDALSDSDLKYSNAAINVAIALGEKAYPLLNKAKGAYSRTEGFKDQKRKRDLLKQLLKNLGD
jgi:HEAT repeat protein